MTRLMRLAIPVILLVLFCSVCASADTTVAYEFNGTMIETGTPEEPAVASQTTTISFFVELTASECGPPLCSPPSPLPLVATALTPLAYYSTGDLGNYSGTVGWCECGDVGNPTVAMLFAGQELDLYWFSESNTLADPNDFGWKEYSCEGTCAQVFQLQPYQNNINELGTDLTYTLTPLSTTPEPSTF